jgi:hypothetical protein
MAGCQVVRDRQAVDAVIGADVEGVHIGCGECADEVHLVLEPILLLEQHVAGHLVNGRRDADGDIALDPDRPEAFVSHCHS